MPGNGDRQAFEALMRAHEAGIVSVCRRFTKSEDDAEDLALETFVEAYQKLGQLRQPESFSPGCIGLRQISADPGIDRSGMHRCLWQSTFPRTG